MSGEEFAQDNEPQGGQKTPDHDPQIGLAQAGDDRVLAELNEDWRGVPGQDRDGCRQGQAQPGRVAHHRADRPVTAGSQVLGHDRGRPREHPDRERHHDPVEVPRQGTGSDGFGADAPHHDDVRRHDCHVCEVRQDERNRKTHDGLRLAPGGGDSLRRVDRHRVSAVASSTLLHPRATPGLPRFGQCRGQAMPGTRNPHPPCGGAG